MMQVIQVERIQHLSAVRPSCEEKAETPSEAVLFSSRNKRRDAAGYIKWNLQPRIKNCGIE